MRKLVMLESPYRGATLEERRQNELYARLCLRDSIDRGEAPMASHLLYTQVLDEDVPEERILGIDLGLEWRRSCELAAFYLDRGWSPGMLAARGLYERTGKPMQFRSLKGR